MRFASKCKRSPRRLKMSAHVTSSSATGSKQRKRTQRKSAAPAPSASWSVRASSCPSCRAKFKSPRGVQLHMVKSQCWAARGLKQLDYRKLEERAFALWRKERNLSTDAPIRLSTIRDLCAFLSALGLEPRKSKG